MDLNEVAMRIGQLADVKTILEVGAGDGMLASRLLHVFRSATYLGVDIAPAPGMLFQGDRSRARFETLALEDLTARDFDLVVLNDVLHHVPRHLRLSLAADAASRVGARGLLAVKDWEGGRNAANAAAYVADRFITGDRNVSYFRPGELIELLSNAMPTGTLRMTARIPPRRNNLLIVLTPADHADSSTG